MSSTIGDLYEKFEEDLKPRFTRHVFNFAHQYKVLRELKDGDGMSEDEAILH